MDPSEEALRVVNPLNEHLRTNEHSTGNAKCWKGNAEQLEYCFAEYAEKQDDKECRHDGFECSLFSGRLILAVRQSDKCGRICEGVHDREKGEEYGNRMSDQIILGFRSSTPGRPL